jgi:rhodanese-related sulfurtransferase
MLTDGSLMRLSKQQFLDILKKQLVHYLKYDLALAVIKSGGRWLDVRLAEEHAQWALDDSISIPLATVRANTSRLDKNLKYVIYCDTGRRSAAAAFLLSQRGYNVSALEGGLNESMASNALVHPDSRQQGSGGKQTIAPLKPAAMASVAEFQGKPDAQAADTARDSASTRQHLDGLEAEVAALKTELQAYAGKALAMEAACKAERTAHSKLANRINALLSQLK